MFYCLTEEQAVSILCTCLTKFNVISNALCLVCAVTAKNDLFEDVHEPLSALWVCPLYVFNDHGRFICRVYCYSIQP